MEPDRATGKKLPTCPSCGNRLRLRADQVGTQVICPKCNSAFMVQRPGTVPRAAVTPAGASPSAAVPTSPAADDAYEPEVPLVRYTIVPQEEMSDIGPLGGGESQYDVDWSVADDLEAEAPHVPPPSAEPDYLALAKAKGIVRNLYVPDPPRWTFFSGVFTYPWEGVNLARWTVMSIGLSASGMMFWQTATLMGLFGSGLSREAILGIVSGIVTIGISLASLSYCAATVTAVIQDTADGHAVPQESSLPDWDQWIFSFLNLFCLWAASAALGYPFSLIEPIGPAACLVSSLVLFPVLLLSAMEADSFFVPYSPNVLATVIHYWYGWFMFYLLTTAMLVGWLFGLQAGLVEMPFVAMFLSGPVLAALILIYARLLGRLAWRASGARMTAQEDSGDAKPAAARRGKKKRRQRIRLELPDELDAAAGASGGDAPPPQRITFHRRS